MQTKLLLIRTCAVLLSLAAGSVCTAAGGSKPLSAQDLARVRNHEAAVVLLQVIETIDGAQHLGLQSEHGDEGPEGRGRAAKRAAAAAGSNEHGGSP